MKTNKVSACSWKAKLSFEMLHGQFKIYILSEKAVSKIWKFIHFLDHSFAFQSIFWKVNFLESLKKSEFQINSDAWSLNEEQWSIILQTKNFPRRLLIHRYVEFSQNVDWKMIVIISLKMRNPGFENFFESGFSYGNHCLKWWCSISKDS